MMQSNRLNVTFLFHVSERVVSFIELKHRWNNPVHSSLYLLEIPNNSTNERQSGNY